MAATMRSLTSPVIAPLYWPTQARSDCSARRSACAIALAGSAGVCSAGRLGTVVTGLGLAPAVDGAVICAGTEVPAARNAVMQINVAVSIDLMTNPGSIDVAAIKHICLVSNNRAMVPGTWGRRADPSLRGAQRRSNPVALDGLWMASRSLSSGGRLRRPLARNDGYT